MSARGLDVGCKRKEGLKGDFKGLTEQVGKAEPCLTGSKKDLDQTVSVGYSECDFGYAT